MNNLEEKQNWFFTFGFGSGRKNNFVCIFGTFNEAREEMMRRYEKKWAMQYNSSEFEDQEKTYGLIEIDKLSNVE